jgi:hypothetical protein
MTKLRKRKKKTSTKLKKEDKKDFNQIKCIKDDADRLLVKDDAERSTMKAIFLIIQLMERHREQKDLHMIFIDLEKAYDKIPRNIMWWAVKRKLVPTTYVTLIKDIYTNVVTCVRACDGESDTFPIKIGLN